MKNRPFFAVAILCAAAGFAQAVSIEAAPRAFIDPVSVDAWACVTHNFLTASQPESYTDPLKPMLASLKTLDWNDPAVAKALEPLAQEVQAAAAQLLKPELAAGVDPQLAAKTLKLRALAETPLGALIPHGQRWRAEALYRAHRAELSVQESARIEARMSPIIASLGAANAADEAVAADASRYEAGLHAGGLQPSGLSALAKAQAYFKEKGIPVTSVRYQEGYSTPGMTEYDGDSWTPPSLTVAFGDAATYRRWKDALPRKIAGMAVYADSRQAAQADAHAQVEREHSLLARARDAFAAKGVPATSLTYDGEAIMARFADTQAYRDSRSKLPAKIDGARVYADAKHVAASNKLDEDARRAALVARARAFLEAKGYSVKDVGYLEGYTLSGMSPYDADTSVSERLSVTFTDAENLQRWNRRWFHTAAGLSVEAKAEPAPGLGFPDPKDHYAAAKTAAGAADAQFVAASANLDNKSQNWGYTFFSARTKEFLNVVTDFLGRASLTSRRPARDLIVKPIDLGKVIPLEQAYAAAKAEGLAPVWVNLDRDIHGKVLYRFSDKEGSRQVRVDAVTGTVERSR